MTFSYILDLDGAEQVRASEAESQESAIADARALLLAMIAADRPQAAFCAVLDGQGEEARPLGYWDYGGAQPMWSPEA